MQPLPAAWPFPLKLKTVNLKLIGDMAGMVASITEVQTGRNRVKKLPSLPELTVFVGTPPVLVGS
jgi:hypothetical protein